MAAPASIPDWVKCTDVASLITTDTEPASLVVRAVAWPEGAAQRGRRGRSGG